MHYATIFITICIYFLYYFINATNFEPWIFSQQEGAQMFLTKRFTHLEPGRAVSIVDLPLGRIRQYRVRVVDFFELKNKVLQIQLYRRTVNVGLRVKYRIHTF